RAIRLVVVGETRLGLAAARGLDAVVVVREGRTERLRDGGGPAFGERLVRRRRSLVVRVPDDRDRPGRTRPDRRRRTIDRRPGGVGELRLVEGEQDVRAEADDELLGGRLGE